MVNEIENLPWSGWFDNAVQMKKIMNNAKRALKGIPLVEPFEKEVGRFICNNRIHPNNSGIVHRVLFN